MAPDNSLHRSASAEILHVLGQRALLLVHRARARSLRRRRSGATNRARAAAATSTSAAAAQLATLARAPHRSCPRACFNRYARLCGTARCRCRRWVARADLDADTCHVLNIGPDYQYPPGSGIEPVEGIDINMDGMVVWGLFAGEDVRSCTPYLGDNRVDDGKGSGTIRFEEGTSWTPPPSRRCRPSPEKERGRRNCVKSAPRRNPARRSPTRGWWPACTRPARRSGGWMRAGCGR
jgi:hypothetical protein